MRKLAIVGTHPRTRSQAPFDDPEYDIWVFNEAPQAEWCKRWNVCFQMHKPEVYTSPNNFVRADHWDWLQADHGAGHWIVMQADDKRVPNCVRYPLDEIEQFIPGAHLRWFKSTPAYAIALALWRGYNHISIYGLDMASNTEYGYQLPNFQFWVGVAMGMGATIDNHSNEQFFSGALYAYEGEIQIDRAYFMARAEKWSTEYKSRKWEVEKVAGRLKEAIETGNYGKARDLIAEYQEAAMNAGEACGAMDTANRYAERVDLIPRQEFERTAAQAQIDAETKRREMWIAQGESQYTWNGWKQSGNIAVRDQMRGFVQKQAIAAEECGIRSGTMRENFVYMEKIDELVTAAGGQRTIAALAGA